MAVFNTNGLLSKLVHIIDILSLKLKYSMLGRILKLESIDERKLRIHLLFVAILVLMVLWFIVFLPYIILQTGIGSHIYMQYLSGNESIGNLKTIMIRWGIVEFFTIIIYGLIYLYILSKNIYTPLSIGVVKIYRNLLFILSITTILIMFFIVEILGINIFWPLSILGARVLSEATYLKDVVYTAEKGLTGLIIFGSMIGISSFLGALFIFKILTPNIGGG